MKNRIFHFCTVLVLWMSLFPAAHAETIVLAVPGPGTLSYLPIYLAKAIAADQAEGVELKLRYFSGGPLAMRDLMGNNSDFLAIGLPAIAAGRALRGTQDRRVEVGADQIWFRRIDRRHPP